MKILGFDCSSKTIDCVILDGEGNWIRSFSVAAYLDTTDMDARLMDVTEKMYNKLESMSIDGSEYVAYIENAIYLQNVKVTIAIAQVIAVTKKILFDLEIKFFGIDNKSWKKDILGDGKANKEKIMAFAKIKWGDWITSQDIADAACIALYGVRRLG